MFLAETLLLFSLLYFIGLVGTRLSELVQVTQLVTDFNPHRVTVQFTSADSIVSGSFLSAII